MTAVASQQLQEYIDAALQASDDGTINSGIKPLIGPGGQPFESEIDKDGFSAQAFVTPDNKLLVAYAGTEIEQLNSKQTLVTSALVDDVEIYRGYNPPAFADGSSFLQQAEAVAAAQGISTAPGNVLVAGHSLGGAIAAYVAAQDNLPGATFGAPGLGPDDIPSGANSGQVTAYVDYGDPVGNYGGNPDVEGALLHNFGIARYGTTDYIGTESDRAKLTVSALIYNLDGKLGLADFLYDADQYHSLTNDYAAFYNLTPTDVPPAGPHVSLLELKDAIEQAVADAPDVSVAFGSDPKFVAPTTAVLTGTASSPAGVQSVDITADVDGTETDLGTAPVNSDGTWSFTDVVGSHTQSGITATTTDAIGNSATGTATFLLSDGKVDDLYGAGAPPSAPTGTTKVSAPGQIFESGAYRIFDNDHQENTTFVFNPGFGIDVIHGFKASGAGSDLIALPSSDFRNLAGVLRDTGDVNGSAFITDPVTGDAIRVAGVTTAELKANPKDFVLV